MISYLKGNIRSKHLCVVVSMLLVFMFTMLMAASENVYAETIASGDCGDYVTNATWTLDDTGVLTIAGSGNMQNFASHSAPWYSDYHDQITNVVIGDGIKTIGNYAFQDCTKITSLEIGDTVETIGAYAFANCYGLSGKTVTFPASLKYIMEQSFGWASIGTYTMPDFEFKSDPSIINIKDKAMLLNAPPAADVKTMTIAPYRTDLDGYTGQLFKVTSSLSGLEDALFSWYYNELDDPVWNDFATTFITSDTSQSDGMAGLTRGGIYGATGHKIDDQFSRWYGNQLHCRAYKAAKDGDVWKLYLVGKSNTVDQKKDDEGAELRDSTTGLKVIMFKDETLEIRSILGRSGLTHVNCENMHFPTEPTISASGTAGIVTITPVSTDGDYRTSTFTAVKAGKTDIDYSVYSDWCIYHGKCFTADSPLSATIKVIVIGDPTYTATKNSITIKLTDLPQGESISVTLNGETKSVTPNADGTGSATFEGLTEDTEYPYSVQIADAAVFKTAKTLVDHNHEFKYEAGTGADADKINATCINDDGNCPLNNQPVTLTIVAPAKTTYGDAGSPTATLDNLSVFNTNTGDNVTAESIEYYKATKDPSTGVYTRGDKLTAGAPSNAGDYIAEITVHGKTAYVGYTIAKAEVTAPTIQSKVYTGDTLTADVTVEDSTPYEVAKNDGGIKVASYDVVLTLKDTDNYKWADSDEANKTLAFQITPAQPPEVIVPTLNPVTYDPAKTLNDVTLPAGWEWSDKSIVPDVGNDGYEAALTVDDRNYDYSEVPGYDKENHTVIRTIELTVNKAEGAATVTLDDQYEGTTDYAPTLESENYGTTADDVEIKYFKKDGDDYTELTEKPTALGEYRVSVTFKENDRYLATTVTDDFKIINRPPQKVEGTATVTLADQIAGTKDYEPTLASEDYSTAAADVTIKYFKKDGDTYVELTEKPTEVGEYRVAVTFKENDRYLAKTVTADYKITAAPEPTPADQITYDDLTDSEKADADKIVENFDVDNDTAAKMLRTGEELGVPLDTMLLSTKAVKAVKDDKDPKGTTFAKLTARAVKRGKTTMRLQWKTLPQADGYLIYANKCGLKYRYKLAKTVKSGKTNKWYRKKLKKHTYYKYLVVAYKNVAGQKLPIGASVTVHCTTKADKNTIAKAVKLKKTSLTIAKGKTVTLKGKEVKMEAKKVIKEHRGVNYESLNPKIAKVNKKTGKITGVSAGKTTIYVYCQNGVYKKVSVTVK